MGFPIHQNLSTSFVNLSALVRHLRDLQFTGSVKVELSSYEAEIIFTANNRLQAREYDRLVGRISQGEHAFARILVRSREPFGRIHVLLADAHEMAQHIKKAFIDERIVSDAKRTILGRGDQPVVMPSKTTGRPKNPDQSTILANELLVTLDHSFRKGKMSFPHAFANACGLLSDRYAFLDPQKGLLSYRDEKLRLREPIEAAHLFEAVVAALSHILDRLKTDAKFTKLVTYTRHRIQQHLSSRHTEYSDLRLIAIVDRLVA